MCKDFLVIVLYLEIYQLGSLFIFGQKLIRVYVRGCIKNILLSISKNTMVAGECFFGFERFYFNKIILILI